MKKYWAVLSIGFILGLWSNLIYASGTNLLNLISFTPTDDYVNAVYKVGNYIYVADGMAGLKIFEATQDSGTNSLRLIGRYKITSGDILDVQVQGKYGYITNGEDGLIIIDISNPQEPELVSRCDTPGHAIGVKIKDNYAYVADGQKGLIIIDITNPGSPTIAGKYDTPDYALDVWVTSEGEKRYAYIADASSGLLIIEITDLRKPRLIGKCDTPGYASKVWVKGRYAYIADSEGGIQIINIANPTNPTSTNSYSTKDAQGIYLDDKYAYIADGSGGLKVYILKDDSLTFINEFDVPVYATDVFVSNNYVYVTDVDNGVFTLNLTESETLSELQNSTESETYFVNGIKDIVVNLNLNQEEYLKGEFVYGTVSVTNNGPAIVLIFLNPVVIDFDIKNENNQTVYSSDVVLPKIKEISLNPNETNVIWEGLCWNQQDNDKNSIPIGNYTISASWRYGERELGSHSKQITILLSRSTDIKPEELDGTELSEGSRFILTEPPDEVKREFGEITIVVPEIKLTEIIVEEISGTMSKYLRFSISDGGFTSEIGKPELPTFGGFFEIPHDVDLILEDKGGKYATQTRYCHVYPVQEPLIDSTYEEEYEEEIDRGEGKIGTINDTFYREIDDFYPKEYISIGEPIILREHKLIPINVCPVQYNPVKKELKIWSKIVVKIDYSEEAEIVGIEERLENPEFESLISSFVLNYKSPGDYPTRTPPVEFTKPGAEYLIITHDDFYDAIAPLAEWKHKKGISTKVVKLSNISPQTSDGIKEFIRDAYTTWEPAPVYILLVGDVDKIPTNYKTPHPSRLHRNANIGTDLYYATMDGGKKGEFPDYSPDLFVGRLCVKTAEEVEIIVNKILNYEKNPGGKDSKTDWLKHILFAAEYQNKRTDPNRATRFFLQTSEILREIMEREGKKGEDRKRYETTLAYTPKYPVTGDCTCTYYHGGSISKKALANFKSTDESNEKIKKSINEGCVVVLHRDHGESRNFRFGRGKEGWITPRFLIDDVNELSNGHKLPLFFSLNCMSGWFDGETDEEGRRGHDSIGEALLKERDKGCIGFIAATRISYSGYNDELAKGFFDAI